MDIGKNVRGIRKGQGKSQVFIAKKMGKTSGWLSNIERGYRKLSAEDAKKLADALGVPVEEIFLENPLNETLKKTNASETEPTGEGE